MDQHEVNPKAVNRIKPELEKALKDNRLLTVVLKDGKGLCPGCSQEVALNDPAANVRFTSVPVLCPSCKTEFRVTAQDQEADKLKDMEGVLASTGAELLDDDDEGGTLDIPEEELIRLFAEHKNPTDEEFHKLCEEKGWNEGQAEAVAYRFATRYALFRLGGKSKGKRPERVISSEESMGQEVEYEHTSHPADALKIAWDHLAEAQDSKYYTFLELLEKTIKAGPEHPIYKKMMKLTEEAESLPSEH